MSQKAPGKAEREGISLIELFRMFPDDDAARKWFEAARWGGRPFCPHCGTENVQAGITHKSMTHRCRENGCSKKFSVKVGTAMEKSRIPMQKWAIAIYLMTTSLKSVSSMKLHRDLNITQKSAWFLAHRIREWMNSEDKSPLPFSGPIEADETYMGGKRQNMSKAKRAALSGRGAVGKAAVTGLKDRASNQVRAKVVEKADAETLQGFLVEHADAFATIYTDDATPYASLKFPHETVKHSAGEYVKGTAHTNGIESFWSMLKRAHKGTFHQISHKHLDRYVQEFVGRHNVREHDTLAQMTAVVKGLEGKRLTYAQLKA